MVEPERRRRRPAVSCALCRRRKIRCNRQLPCNNCSRSNRGDSCVYEDHAPLPQRQNLVQRDVDVASTSSSASTVWSRPATSLTPGSTDSSVTPRNASAQEIETMKRQIKQLEEQLAKSASLSTPSAHPLTGAIETTSSSFGGTFNVMPRSVGHKKRVFGQSHWMNNFTLFRDIIEMLEPHARDGNSKLVKNMRKAKSLARVIKSSRAPSWPTPPTADLPSKDVADELIDGYLRTFETVFRILHVPTFKRDYEAIWVSDTTINTAFLVQLKLVLAIGATIYDETFSLRSLATRWVYEGLTWLSAPVLKPRLGLQYLQTSILILIAREQVNVCEEVIWISMGALLRTGISMGLHRDPAQLPRMSVFEAEMRRRIWNTILEIALQSSLASGGPCLLSLTDFDTEAPGNFDDEQLTTEDPVPKNIGEYTQASVAIAFRKTLSARLAVIKSLNDIGPTRSYEETLQVDGELRNAYKTLRQTLQAYTSGPISRPTGFELQMVDFIMHRYRSSLHVPFFTHKTHEAPYTYSRKVVVESSFKMWRAACPYSTTHTIQPEPITPPSARDDLARITINGSGFFRHSSFLASHHLAVELRAQIQEEESISATPLRPDLLSVLEEGKAWNISTIKAGETGIKGYLLSCLIATQIEGLEQRLGSVELQTLLVSVAEEAEDRCIPVLEALAEQNISGGGEEIANDASWFTYSDNLEDWDMLGPDPFANLGGAGSVISWFDTQDLIFNL